jgi:hypothetical protein
MTEMVSGRSLVMTGGVRQSGKKIEKKEKRREEGGAGWCWASGAWYLPRRAVCCAVRTAAGRLGRNWPGRSGGCFFFLYIFYFKNLF